MRTHAFNEVVREVGDTQPVLARELEEVARGGVAVCHELAQGLVLGVEGPLVCHGVNTMRGDERAFSRAASANDLRGAW